MDAANFREFEHAGWIHVPREYHESWGALTSQTIPALLDAAGAGSGVKLLDIATGPGYVAGAAAERGANVDCRGLLRAMIAQARQIYPDVDFREGDAEHLPFAAGNVRRGGDEFRHSPSRPAGEALLEACKVLKKGARFAFTAWAHPRETVAFRIVLESIELTEIFLLSCRKVRHFFVSVIRMNVSAHWGLRVLQRQQSAKFPSYGGFPPATACFRQ